MKFQDEIQIAQWDTASLQGRYEDQVQTTNYFKENYQWCREQLDGME